MNKKRKKNPNNGIVSVPEYLKLTQFPLEMFVEFFENSKEKVSIRKKHWLYLIKNNMLTCPVTKKKVAYCSYDYKKNVNSYHYNFYSEDGDMFTIDHIKPKVKGGTNSFDNIQPMIAEENFKKEEINMNIECPNCGSENAYYNGVEYECPDCDYTFSDEMCFDDDGDEDLYDDIFEDDDDYEYYEDEDDVDLR